MNVYEVTPQDNGFAGDYEVFYHVVAPTRGKAWTLFMEYEDQGYEFTDRKWIKLLAKNVDLPEGVDEEYRWAKSVGIEIPIVEF